MDTFVFLEERQSGRLYLINARHGVGDRAYRNMLVLYVDSRKHLAILAPMSAPDWRASYGLVTIRTRFSGES